MRLIWLVRSCLVEANASYGAVRERGDIAVQSASGATRVSAFLEVVLKP